MKKLCMSVFFLILLTLFCFLYWKIALNKRDYNQILEISKEIPLKKSIAKLEGSDNIVFRVYLKLRNGGRDIKAGYYELKGKYSLKEIVDLLEEGRYKKIKFTIPEGYTYEDVVSALEYRDLIDRKVFEDELSKIEFPYPVPNGNFEGYFYPETYFIPEGATEKEIIDIIIGEFLKKFPKERYEDGERFYEMLILASIIQREAQIAEEKKLISSVFHNRLELGMKLASDATVNYVYGYQKKRMYYKDLEIDSPYNTYKYTGLPPAPICNPDYQSVEAAFNPLDTDYIFFVARGDGSHYFSKTYEEHMRFQRENEKKR